MENKLTLDFTMNVSQDVAIMPASLARTLLMDYAERMTKVSQFTIINAHISDLRDMANAGDLEGAVTCSQNFVNERTLIDNISKENWDAYKGEPVKAYKHTNLTINTFRNDAQDAMNTHEYTLCSELINLIAAYGTDEGEEAYLRLYTDNMTDKEIVGTIK